MRRTEKEKKKKKDGRGVRGSVWIRDAIANRMAKLGQGKRARTRKVSLEETE